MSERFSIEISWEHTGTDGLNFSRDHVVRYPGKAELHASSAPAFGGNVSHVNPEELFVSAVSSCQMLTYLFLCFKNKMIVQSYEDHAEGILERLSPGKFWMKEVTLRPVIRFSGAETQQARAMAIRLIHEAHDNCFIAQSVRSEVHIEPSLVFL